VDGFPEEGHDGRKVRGEGKEGYIGGLGKERGAEGFLLVI